MRPTVPPPGHEEGCDGGMKAVKTGREMGPVCWEGQGLWSPLHGEVFHEGFGVALIPVGMAPSCKEGAQSWFLGSWRTLVWVRCGSPCTSCTRRMRWGSILLPPHLNSRD